MSEELNTSVFRTTQSTPLVEEELVAYTNLDGVISQKNGPFISTATRTSNLDPKPRLYFTNNIKPRSLYITVCYENVASLVS
jgi:hypothetical protein